jgi:hypothetical protein
MNPVKITLLTLPMLVLMFDAALAAPSAQINIPSTDAKGLAEVAISINNYTHFSDKAAAGLNSYSVGVETGLLPFEAVKVEVGVDYLTTGTSSAADDHPFYFNAKLATAEDLGVQGLPAFAVGIYNLGTYDKPETGVSTRQNIAYALAAKTLPVVGRISVGGYVAAERALQTSGNPRNNSSGIMASWDRTISELSDKLWLGVDYMSGNNANGEISFGASWSFSKQVNLLAGVVWYNPFYTLSAADNGMLPGGKPAFTTQLTINLP